MRCAAVLCAALCATAAAAPIPITVDWGVPTRQLITTPAFQTVVNSLTTRVAPQHDAIFTSIKQLGAQYQVGVLTPLELWDSMVEARVTLPLVDRAAAS